ncbi:hypothetical protein NDU88_002849 [Pleurodeles waltl]|uniref:Uncharacterized protein n=1 Tax=Pleurodeles waltl TaxID=8319 RepID=A0AAV7UAF2_PLEWA|nr:hypothetical protein NDU88_002849 [Pleurodeles waltl]
MCCPLGHIQADGSQLRESGDRLYEVSMCKSAKPGESTDLTGDSGVRLRQASRRKALNRHEKRTRRRGTLLSGSAP